MLKGAYGRVDAPCLWFMELKKGLEALGFIPIPLGPCVFILENPKYTLTMGYAVGLRCFNKSFKHWQNGSPVDLTRNEILLSLDCELTNNLTVPFTSVKHNTSKISIQSPYPETGKGNSDEPVNESMKKNDRH